MPWAPFDEHEKPKEQRTPPRSTTHPGDRLEAAARNLDRDRNAAARRMHQHAARVHASDKLTKIDYLTINAAPGMMRCTR